jgi:hypothetical protein
MLWHDLTQQAIDSDIRSLVSIIFLSVLLMDENPKPSPSTAVPLLLNLEN